VNEQTALVSITRKDLLGNMIGTLSHFNVQLLHLSLLADKSGLLKMINYVI